LSRSGFLLAEDEAIKERFTGLTVSDDRNASRPVQVFFRYPEGETERFYPFITIELIDVVYSRNRQHSVVNQYAYVVGDAWAVNEPSALTYWPSVSSTVTVPANHKYSRTTEFVPVDILYQVSTFTRSALHDRQLTAKLLYDVVPFRYNSIYIPADNTSRRFDLLDWTTADLLDPEAGYRKRIFRKIYTLQMTAELPSSDFVGIKQATQIKTTIIPSSASY
jgi:hypothetical protein